MTRLLSRTLPMALALMLGISGNFAVQSETKETEETVITDAAIEATQALRNALDDASEAAPAGDEIAPRVIEPRVTSGEPEPLTPPPSHPLNIVLDWYPTPYHAPLIVARERDLFAREGLDVTLTAPADPTVPAKLVAAQRAELALTSQPRLHLLVAQGLPLIRVGTLVPAPLATLLVREESGIDTLGQLKGKTVGFAHEASARLLLDGMLEDHAFSSDDLELQPVNFALTRSLAEGQVDAVIGAPRHVARQQLAREGISAREYPVEEGAIPVYDELILVANRDVLSQHRRDIAHLLDALEQATLWIINHPEQAWELVRNAEPGLDTEANARAWPDTLRYLALRPALLQARRYSNFESWLLQRGLIETQSRIERLATDISVP